VGYNVWRICERDNQAGIVGHGLNLFSWFHQHWRGIVTVVGVVAGLAAAGTGVGAIADVTVFGVDAGVISTTASVVASAADLPACTAGNDTACAGAAVSLLGGALGAALSSIGYFNELLRSQGAELSILRAVAPGLLAAKAFAIGTGSLFWDFLNDLSDRFARHHG
jgi:hypothetical protein